jgi:hypothetical protein
MDWLALSTMSADDTTTVVAVVVLGGVSVAFLIVLGRMLWHCLYEDPYELLASGGSDDGHREPQDPEAGDVPAQVPTQVDVLQATLAHIGASSHFLDALDPISESDREQVRPCCRTVPSSDREE